MSRINVNTQFKLRYINKKKNKKLRKITKALKFYLFLYY